MTPLPPRMSPLWSRVRSRAPAILLLVAVVAAVTVVAIGLRPAPIAPARPVVVTSGDWAPFVGPDLPGGGPIAELMVEILNRSGYSPEITYTSWALAEEQVTSGASVGVFPLVGSASRRAAFLVSDPLIDFEYVLFYDRRSGEPEIDERADLGRLRVGSIAGYEYWDELESAVAGFVEFGSTLAGFQALADGTIDVLAEGLLSGQAVLADPGFGGDAGDFGYLPGDSPLVHSVEGLHFMMADTAEAAPVMERFNQVLAQLRGGEAYLDIVAGLEPTTPGEVTLLPAERSGLVELLDGDGGLVLLAPRGTRAQVLSWPEAFVGPASPGGASPPSEPLLVQVKITNGPATGRVFHIDARSIELDEVVAP